LAAISIRDAGDVVALASRDEHDQLQQTADDDVQR
jgi:hypothetical protein